MKKVFTAEIKKHPNLDGAYVEIPFNVEEVMGAKRIKVKASFDGVIYKGSIVKMDGRFLIGITQAIRKEIGKNPGDFINVEVEKDEEERTIELPHDFKAALEKHVLAKEYYEKLSFSRKREYYQWIIDAKKPETRLIRITKAIERLGEGKKLK